MSIFLLTSATTLAFSEKNGPQSSSPGMNEKEVEPPRGPRRERGVGRSWNGTQGYFTSFDLLENGISNYTLHTNNTDLLIFESVVVQNMNVEETETRGPRYEIEGDNAEIRIHDVAPALMKIDAETDRDDEENDSGKVSFELGDLEFDGRDGPNLNLSYENHTAKLLSISRGEGGWNESLDVNVSDGFVNYTFEEEIFFVFRMTGSGAHERERDRERMMEQNISEGISHGEIGGQVIVDRDRYGISETAVSYADMQMMTRVRENNRVRVMVSSDSLEDDGKIVSIRIYNEVLEIDALEELEVRFDDKEIEMAEDYDDLVESSDEAEYLVSMGSEKIELLVTVPHFSTHTIEIAREETGLRPLLDIQYYLPVVLLTSVIVLASVWIAKKEN